ncbi:MAG TPA: hypothetical protein VHB21_12720 [Minicystis sp.]|nr:hypothetical protein [Minicystis sp.]
MESRWFRPVITALVAIALIAAALQTAVQIDERRSARERHDAALAKLEKLREQVGHLESAPWVKAATVQNTCVATNNEATCTATNIGEQPVAICMRGRLKKKSADISVKSLTMCSGRIAPHETKQFSAPWAGAFARDLCSSKSQFGTELLDWSVCEFSTEPVDPQ